MTIGERIKARRMELGYSVDELAEKLGKNRATLYRYESDVIKDMPIQVLEPLAKALETTPAELMGWSKDAERFNERVAEPFNRRRASAKEARLLDAYRQLSNINKGKVDRYIENLLSVQNADEELLAAHREKPFNQEDHDHDMEVIKNL